MEHKSRIYEIHDNGGRPFKVEIVGKNVTISALNDDKGFRAI